MSYQSQSPLLLGTSVKTPCPCKEQSNIKSTFSDYDTSSKLGHYGNGNGSGIGNSNAMIYNFLYYVLVFMVVYCTYYFYDSSYLHVDNDLKQPLSQNKLLTYTFFTTTLLYLIAFVVFSMM